MSRDDVERDLPMHGTNTDPADDLAAEIARTFTLNFALRFGAAMSSRCGSPDVRLLRDQLVQKFLATDRRLFRIYGAWQAWHVCGASVALLWHVSGRRTVGLMRGCRNGVE
jgi:hypothetical protein